MTHLDPDSDVAFTIKWWGILLALIVGTIIIFAVLAPYLRAQETRDHRQSLEYIQSHQGALRQIYTQYSDEALSDAQRRALFNQLRHEADLIPNSVPADIQDALNRGVR